MTVYVLMLAILFEGETHIFQYGNRGTPYDFKTKEACERVLEEQKVEVPKMLAASPGAQLQAIKCVPKQVPGV